MGVVVTCFVCEGPLPPLARLRGDRVCGEPCRVRYRALRPEQLCVACGRPLAFRDLAAGCCNAHECLVARDRWREEQDRRRLQAIVARGEAIRRRAADALAIVEPDGYPITLVPAFRSSVANLPERRRRAFRDHLNRLIVEATAMPPRPPEATAAGTGPGSGEPPPSGLAEVLGRACGVCRGRCCRQGDTHAYLTAATIRRVLDDHPELRPRDVLAAYLGRLGPKTYRHSCVFHRPDGCALPRDLRSVTCNTFYCSELSRFRAGHSRDDPPRGLFLAVSGEAIRSAAFVEPGRTVEVPETLLDDPA